MKYIITEQQNDKLVERLTNIIKSGSWDKTAKMVGGVDNLVKILNIDTPMDFLHLFDNMNVVRSKKRPHWTLFRYIPNKNLMVYDKKDESVYFDNNEIWSNLQLIFKLKNSEIEKITKDWLGKVYNLRGVTTQFSGSTFRNTAV
jgi:hypothetical protein